MNDLGVELQRVVSFWIPLGDQLFPKDVPYLAGDPPFENAYSDATPIRLSSAFSPNRVKSARSFWQNLLVEISLN